MTESSHLSNDNNVNNYIVSIPFVLTQQKGERKSKINQNLFPGIFLWGYEFSILSRVSRIVSGVPIIPSNKIIYLFEKSITIITNHDKLNWTLNVE